MSRLFSLDVIQDGITPRTLRAWVWAEIGLMETALIEVLYGLPPEGRARDGGLSADGHTREPRAQLRTHGTDLKEQS